MTLYNREPEVDPPTSSAAHTPDPHGFDLPDAPADRSAATTEAATLFRIADDLIEKAKEHEREATGLYREAQRMNAMGAAVTDGRPIEDEL